MLARKGRKSIGTPERKTRLKNISQLSFKTNFSRKVGSINISLGRRKFRNKYSFQCAQEVFKAIIWIEKKPTITQILIATTFKNLVKSIRYIRKFYVNTEF